MEPLQALNYEPLGSNADFRVFVISPGTKNDRITGTLKDANFTDAANTFSALSYCWGSPNFTEEIIINGCSFKVTPNLNNALRNLRDAKQDMVVWIDQICINQNDNDEKANQVQLMSKIYMCASGVAIWLGVLEHPRRTKRILKRLEPAIKMLPNECFDGQCDIKSVGRLTPKQMSVLNLPSPKSTGWEALQGLLSVAWFSRSWIVQEASMAIHAQFSWGQGWMLWDTMVAVLQTLHLVLPPNVLACPTEEIPANIVLDIDRVRRSLRERKAPDIVSLALRYKHLAAYDPRDKLYAFLSLSRQLEPFSVSYTITKEELYCHTAYKAIGDSAEANSKRGDIRREEESEWHPDSIAIQGPSSRLMALLCSAGLANHSPESRLPSWVPDWAFQSKANPIWTTQVEQRTSGATWWPPTIYESRIIRTRLALKAVYQRWQSRGAQTVTTIETTSSTTVTFGGTRTTAASTTRIGGIGTGTSHMGRTEKYRIYDPRLTTVSWEGSYPTDDIAKTTASLPNTLVLEGVCVEAIGTTTRTGLEPGVPLDKDPAVLQQWLYIAEQLSQSAYTTCRSPPLFLDNPFIYVLCMDKATKDPDAAILTDVPPVFQIPSDLDYDDRTRRYLETHHYLLALRNIRYREFFVTSEGFMGLGPRGIEIEDEIWVIAGFKVPLVFRKEGGAHRLIGECFIGSNEIMAELTRERETYGRICIW